jgi:predicted N-acetyltransferase YhbS
MSTVMATIRLMKAEDYDAVVDIDERVLGVRREEYYQMKFDKLLQSKENLPVSLVAEDETGRTVGFVIGELYMGEYGIYQEKATLDTIGVDPDHRSKGVGQRLMVEFVKHLKSLGVQKLYTLVDWDDESLIPFFSRSEFRPSKTTHLERSL